MSQLPATTVRMKSHMKARKNTNRFQALRVLDILLHIFSFSDRRTLSASARVCRLWSGIALDELWKNLDSLLPVFSAIAPLKRSYSGRYRFTKCLEPDDLVRCLRYSSRIRTLKLGCEAFKIFSERLLSEFILRLQSINLFPRLSDLTLNFDDNDERGPLIAVFLMNNHLSTITVHLPQDHLLSRGFIHELVQHCPDLKSVIFDCDGPTRCMEETLVEFLPKLSRLEEVTLPYLSITSAVTFALSNLPLLEKIAFVDYIIYPEDTEASSLDELRNFLPVLHNNPFPSLKKLSLTANLSNLTAFLRKGIAPCLEFLSVKAVDLENEYSLQSFLTFLSEGRTRSSLTKLVVDMVPYHADAHSVIRTNKEDVGNISFANLEPISCLSSLTYLRIFYHRACKVTDEELVTLVGSLPSLTNLTFCPDPCNLQEKPSLTLKVLPLLAARLPHLEELGLQVDLDSTSELQEVSRPTSFQKLTELNFGTSVVLSDGADWKNIALYLSRLLPSSCTITSGSYLWSPSMETAIGEEFPDVYLPEECEERWDKIADTMYLIIKGREEERKWSTLV